MRITVKQLKALIREASEEAMDEQFGSYSRGGEGGNRHGDSWDSGEKESYEDQRRRQRDQEYTYNSREERGEGPSSIELSGYSESLKEAVAAAYRAGYRKGRSSRR